VSATQRMAARESRVQEGAAGDTRIPIMRRDLLRSVQEREEKGDVPRVDRLDRVIGCLRGPAV